MKKFLKFLMFPVLLFSAIQFSSCNTLHVHDYEIKYNDDTHWEECKICHNKIGEAEHSIDATDRCLICDYHDPVITTNGSRTLTGLTKHGKTKSVLTLTDETLFIDDNAFSGAECSKLYITKNFVGFKDHAFDNSKIDITKEGCIVDPDKNFVTWKYHDGVYYREDHYLENECMIKDGENTKYYKTFREAVEAVGKNEVVITILRDHLDLDGGDYYIDNKITLEVFLSGTEKCEINANGSKFYIRPTGYLRIPDNIEYVADTYLILSIKEEVSGDNKRDKVYTTGSLIYTNTESEPKHSTTVQYVDDSKEHVFKGNAQISKQNSGANDYAYGVLKFDLNFSQIKGLTDYGQTCTTLNVCRPITEDSHPDGWIIGPAAFTVKGYIDIHIPILPDPRVQLWKQKGVYNNLKIGEGITGIGSQAFANYIDSALSLSVRKQIAALLSPINSLEISKGVKTIGNGAFTECVYLNDVTIDEGSELTEIYDNAFSYCLLLKTVNFANCSKLKLIKYKTFWACEELEGLRLPYNKGWTANGFSYLPDQLDPSNAAKLFSSTHAGDDWNRDENLFNAKFAWCNKSDSKDGIFNKVHYCQSFPEENSYNDEATIFVFKDAGDVNLWTDKYINKSVNIVAYEEDYNETQKITFGETKICNNKYLTVSKSIEPEKSIYLKNEISTTSFKKMAGFAKQMKSTNEAENAFAVYYTIQDYSSLIQANTNYATINDKNYMCYGLFNFVHDNGNILRIDGGGNGLSNLGKLASEICISNIGNNTYKTEIGEKSFQYNDGLLEKVEISDDIGCVRNWAFEGCKKLKEVKIGSGVNWIGTRGFRNCPKLEKVEFINNTTLDAIYTQVFDGCGNLKSIKLGDNNVNGWKADGIGISPSDLLDSAKAANLFVKVHNNRTWRRNKS